MVYASLGIAGRFAIVNHLMQSWVSREHMKHTQGLKRALYALVAILFVLSCEFLYYLLKR